MFLQEPERRHQISLAEYRRNLDEIFRRLKKYTSAKIIFALTTPVKQEWQASSDSYGRVVRRNSDPDIYNTAAREVAHYYDIQINDLYSAVVKSGIEKMLKNDGVHFNERGYGLLANTVVDYVKKYIR
jgi:lysophospholipase L1-like esterase